mmetsp:Transcript_20067/g.52115  ORF Transcript_20067/g.52115 Transcript_20067/m.52115 type:complete len:576 (+) Transcript_20067:146-1873(+)
MTSATTSRHVILILASVAATLLAPPAAALDNGLGRLPGLGWNSDYCTNCSHGALGTSRLGGFQNEGFIKHIADVMHNTVQPSGKTFQQLGFEYVNMDASWNLPTRSASGDLQPNPEQWPSGIDNTISYVHSLGLKFGLYGDRGTQDCAKNPGALGHEVADADFMAKHKVDWYKEDSCYAAGSEATAIAEYAKMRDALNATGYPVWFALCGWQTFYASNPNGGTKLANSARIGPDTGTGWSAVLTNIRNGLSVANFSRPGFWGDGSLMLTPGMGHSDDNLMTEARFRTQFTAWSVLAFNILLVGNLSALNPYVLGTWSNEEVIAVNQDPLALPAVDLGAHVEVLRGVHYTSATMQECGGEPMLQNWSFGQPAAQFLSNAAAKVCLNVEACGKTIIYDGCNTNGMTCGSTNTTYHPNEQWVVQASPPAIKSVLPGNLCLNLNADNTVSLASCNPDTPTQRFSYNPASGTVMQTTKNLCLTASGSSPPPVPSTGVISIGRPLTGGAAAIFFLNNNDNSTTVACHDACFAKVGLKPGTSVTVRDLWLHRNIGTVSGGFNATIPGGGASSIFVLTPMPQA